MFIFQIVHTNHVANEVAVEVSILVLMYIESFSKSFCLHRKVTSVSEVAASLPERSPTELSTLITRVTMSSGCLRWLLCLR